MIVVLAGVAGTVLVVALVLGRGAMVKPTFSPEYRTNVTMRNPAWRQLRKTTFAMTLGRDVVLPFLRAEQLDHLRYRIDGHDIFGYERPMIDVVPLSRFTHTIVTLLRRGGLRRPVNSVLRGSFILWFRLIPFLWFRLLPILLCTAIGYAVVVWSGVIPPAPVVTHALRDVGSVVHGIEAHVVHAVRRAVAGWL